jgi:hypothetical protein
MDMDRLTRNVTRVGAAKESYGASHVVRSTALASKRVMNSVMGGLW